MFNFGDAGGAAKRWQQTRKSLTAADEKGGFLRRLSTAALDAASVVAPDAAARVAAAVDGAAPGSCRSYVVEGVCDLRGVALVPGCRIYLRAARPLGNHLHADPEAAAADRCVRAEFCDRGGYQEVAIVRPPRTQLSEWLRRGGSSSS